MQNKTKKYVALVVDDYDTMRKIIPRQLELFGINNIETASSINEALKLINRSDYNLIFIDTQIPPEQKLAYEFCAEIRGICEEDSIIIGMSSDRGYKKNWLDAGANYFLEKPFRLNELEQILKEY